MSAFQIFGILNCTPDSFSDGGDFAAPDVALAQADKLFSDGADFVDVGAEATNPKSSPISWEVEWRRLEHIMPKLLEKYGEKISLDTLHPETADKFLSIGGKILNDVSGFQDPQMVEVAAKYNPICIVNHFPGSSAQEVHKSNIDSSEIVKQDLLDARTRLINAGVDQENIILDPGIGFGKTMRLNEELLGFSALVPDIDVMIGHSRKRFLGEDRMQAEVNVKAAQTAIQAGAKYIRVHDVATHISVKAVDQPSQTD